jgi:phytoene dehydrogenase-like protein
VIGAGHNGLALATYLEGAGLSTAVVESRDTAGGMTRTEEPVLPGFKHNPHANYFAYRDVMPMLRDFGLRRSGLRLTMPAAQHGITFADGRPPIVLHRPGLEERTRRSIAAYSSADADLYLALKGRAATLGSTIAAGIYRPPDRRWFAHQREATEAAYADIGIGVASGSVTARELIDDLFGSPEMRALLYQVAAEFGAPIEEPGSGFAMLSFVLWMTANWWLVLGGMQALADALREAAARVGVSLLTATPVTEILIDGGTAVGVATADGRTIVARRLVASSAGLGQTLLDLVDRDSLGAETTDQVREFDRRPASTVGSMMVCLREPPSYSSARWDPDIDRCFHTMIGFDGPAETLKHIREVEVGMLPTPAGAVRVNTLWDRSQAPRGRHVGAADIFLPPLSSLDETSWEEVAAAYNPAFLASWREFAPNVVGSNILADHFHLPRQYDRKILLKLGPDQYRTPIDRLYLCGAATYPGGGVHGACGYNAYQVIAADLGLVPPAPLL